MTGMDGEVESKSEKKIIDCFSFLSFIIFFYFVGCERSF